MEKKTNQWCFIANSNPSDALHSKDMEAWFYSCLRACRNLIVIPHTLSSWFILRFCKNTIGFNLVKSAFIVDANFAKAYALLFCSLETWVMVYHIKYVSNSLTLCRYASILLSFALYSDITWLTINYESLKISNFSVPIVSTNPSLVREAS